MMLRKKFFFEFTIVKNFIHDFRRDSFYCFSEDFEAEMSAGAMPSAGPLISGCDKVNGI